MNLVHRLTLVGGVAGLLLTSLCSAPRVNAAPTAREHRGSAAGHTAQARQHRLAQLHHLRRARYHRRRGEQAIASSHERMSRLQAANATGHAVQAGKHIRAANRKKG